MSDIKTENVELFKTNLAGVLGGWTKPCKSSLTNNWSPSFITQGSSLWYLYETVYDFTIIGRILELVL